MPAALRSQYDEVARKTVAEITLVEAVNLALIREMENDANVIVLGEDVGVDA